MSTEQFQNKYRIDSARAMWHDYAGGAYFITVCTKNRGRFFWKNENICDPVETRHATSLHTVPSQHAASLHSVSSQHTTPLQQLTQTGQYLHDCLQNITIHHPYAEIPLFVIMPDHWHAIVFIDGNKTPYVRRNICNTIVETRHATSLHTISPQQPQQKYSREQMQNIANNQGWLSVVIGNIKSAVTKHAHKNNIDFSWQYRFHDRIIRDKNEMYRIAKYIENNPYVET